MSDLITDFIEKNVINSLKTLIDSSDSSEISKSAVVVASQFGSGFDISSEENVKKLITSFKKNLTLLIQKTWVEKSDIALKDQLLYQLDVFLSNKSWKDNYVLFLQLINQAVFLMFGQKPDTPDFAEYTLRIDPEFGIFWWYISNLPPKTEWSEEKCRLAMLLGMYFLANY